MGTPLASDRAAAYVAECISPQLEAGRHPIKRELGDRVTVAADIFRHGHAAVEPRLLYRLVGAGRSRWRETPMESEGNDRFRASFELDALGTWEFTFSLDGERWATRWPVLCERVRARYGSWYEMFPRSQGTDPTRSATLREAAARLDEIAGMGFDVVYLPPIHPIGHSHRKGPNNSLTAGPGDPGSPYAIGSEAGGHDAIEPGLGTLDDFDHFVAEAESRGMEVALDFALNCSPDHPYVREHPDWFFHRPDGTIQYAENPPKKYEDIYPLNFEGPAREAIAQELLRVLTFWAAHRVRIFRVDNPHTKPMALWERLIAGVRARYPDVIFLSEAFTRPKPMKHLAKLGFSQSYTYFTWRNQKDELRAYAEELALGPSREYFRPNFFVNTPDILPPVLQTGGRAAFLMRLVLAATLAPNYGMYSGFELCEGRAVPGTEEYLDSEKYQFKVWDWDRPGNIKDTITLVNRIRREHPALQRLEGIRFLRADNPQMLLYARYSPGFADVLVVAVNLDPHNTQESPIEIPADELGLNAAGFEVNDLLATPRGLWRGRQHYLKLDHAQPAAILHLR
ncbi:MAG TPA: maltotransferase domain-containing protein [Terriglobales bacterium]|nr:maltotransferase domain-containing protein [Terriglobales bacterium]